MKSEQEILDHMRALVAGALGVLPAEVDVEAELSSLGLDSIRAFHLAGDMAEWLDRDISPTLLWDHPTLLAVAGALAREEPGDP